MSILDSILTSLFRIPEAPRAVREYFQKHTLNNALELSRNNSTHFVRAQNTSILIQAPAGPVLAAGHLLLGMPAGLRDIARIAIEASQRSVRVGEIPVDYLPFGRTSYVVASVGLFMIHGMLEGVSMVGSQVGNWRNGSLNYLSPFEIGYEVTYTLGAAGLMVMGARNFTRGGGNFFNAMRTAFQNAGELSLNPASATAAIASGVAALPASGLAEMGVGTLMMSSSRPPASSSTSSRPLSPDQINEIRARIGALRERVDQVRADRSLNLTEKADRIYSLRRDITYLQSLIPVEEMNRLKREINDSRVVNVLGGRFVMGAGEEARVVEVPGVRMTPSPITWEEFSIYYDHMQETPYAVIGRNTQTGHMEVLARGESRQALAEALSAQRAGGLHDGLEIARMVPEAERFRVPNEFRNAGERDLIPSRFGDHPVVQVTWYEALGFADWWGREHFGRPGRLPTEAEWEHGARGGVARVPASLSEADWRLFFEGPRVEGQFEEGQGVFGAHENPVILGPDGSLALGARILTGEKAWNEYRGGQVIGTGRVFSSGAYAEPAICSSVMQTRKSTRAISEGLANFFGLRDMSGNVWEWGDDGWHYSDQGVLDPNPIEAATIKFRIRRGGSWLDDRRRFLYAANRSILDPGVPGNVVGFRVAFSQD